MISRKTAKKLASLSAVGAGALVLTAEKAEAGIIYQSLQPSPPTVGFHHSDRSYFSVPLGTFGGSGSYGFGFSRAQQGTNRSSGFLRERAVGASVFNNVKFATHSGTLQIFGAGAVWGASSRSAFSQFGVAARIWGKFSSVSSPPITLHTALGDASFQDGYALFSFAPGGGTPLYGWVELSLSVSNAYGFRPGLGPNLTVLEYAYDNSGNQLAAGSGTPEPESLSLAALALGALGLRRWRAARKNKAA